MPRPKRSKVAPSAPNSRVRKPTNPPPEVETETKAAKIGFNDLYDVSDPEEGLVTTMRHVKKNNGKGRAVDVAHEQSSVRRTNARGLEREESVSEPAENELSKGNVSSQRRSEEAVLDDIDLESSSPAVEFGRRERGTPAVENSLLAIGNFRRRPRQPSILGRAAARARSSSVESNLAESNGLTSVGKRNPSLGNFSRHSRSIMGRNTSRMRSSSIGLEIDNGTPMNVGSALKIGNFKRRAREPSILRTAQKEQHPSLEYDDGDRDDFSPEDESTPLNFSKTRAVTTSSASSKSNPRKRKLSAVPLPQSSPTLPSIINVEPQQAVPASTPLNDEVEHEDEDVVHSEDLPMSSIEARSVTPELMSETMAPPQSSSPTPESPPSYRAAQRLRAQREPTRGRPRLRNRTPPPATQDSPISSPPSLTHSPNFPAAKAPRPNPRRQAPPPSTFSTAQLQALLPRRRRRGPRGPFDIASSEDEVDVSGLGSDDDELTHSAVRAPPRRPGSVVKRLPAPVKKPTKSKATANLGQPGLKQTYGSRANATSDKENEAEVDPDDSLGPLPDDEEGNGSPETSQELEKRVGKELKRAARKFAEVDEWELDFEEATASSSSPKDAR